MKKSAVVIHHSATADGESVSWGAIRRYHVETNGWRDIGYHLGIELVGDHYEALVGRPFDEDGAHCYQEGRNRDALGVCFVGNFDLAPPPEEMLRFGAKVLRSFMSDMGISLDRVYRHSTFAPKTCPGTQFPWERFVKMLEGA